MKKIAIIDPASYALPYDYYYLKSLSNNYHIDFYCSDSKFNSSYISKIRDLPNVTVKEYSISNVNRVLGVLGLIRMYANVVRSSGHYKAINIQWSVFKVIDIVFYLIISSKLVFTFHNVKPHKSAKEKSRFNYLLYKISKKVLFVSKYTMEEFLRLHSLPKEKSFLLNHGIMLLTDDNLEKSNQRFDSKLGNLKAVFWGNVKEYKGLSFLVDSIEKLVDNNIELEVYGKFDKDQIVHHDKLLSKGCISVNNYLSLEYVANILTRPNVLVVLPYKNASQSGIMFNLLAHNIPFISTKCGETHRFLVENGLGDLTFEYGDKDSLIQAFQYYLKNQSYVAEMFNKCNKGHNWNYDKKQLERIFG